MKIPISTMKEAFRLISLLVLPALASAQGYAPVVHKLSPAIQQKARPLNPEYLVHAPVGTSNAKLPLLIFLHGTSRVGQNIQHNKARPSDFRKGTGQFGERPCIVVAPQCLKTTSGERRIWTPGDLNVLLQHLKATLPVADRRIYISGIRDSGYGACARAAHDPHHFAAIAPIVGGVGREGAKAVTRDFDQWATSLAKIPVCAFVGGLDKPVPPDRSERMVATTKKAGGKEAKPRFIRRRAMAPGGP